MGGYPKPDLTLRKMPAPSNRIPVRPGRGERATLANDLSSIQEGEIVYARDEDSLYIKENGVLVNVAQGVGVGDQIISAEIKWTIGINGGAYIFTGQGFDNTQQNPTIYVIRGQKYKFIHALGTDPFQITTTNGTPYVIGQINTPADNSTLSWEVSMRAPQRLKYASTTDATGKTGDIIVISDTFSLNFEDLTNVGNATASDGQVMVYSTSQNEWNPADVTSGGITNLAGLSDVNTTGAILDDVLKYNGQFWEAAPEATDPGSPGRKSTVSITDSRSGQMLGTEFILGSDTNWTSLGFSLIPQAEGNFTDDWDTINWPLLETWSPLGRADSNSYDGSLYFDGSGRVHTFANNPDDFAPIASTKGLSSPQNGAFAMTAFLQASNCSVYKAGEIQGYTYKGEDWNILRVEYDTFGDKLAVEYWFSALGNFKMLYGRGDGSFVFDTNSNKNGFTFSSRTDDATLGAINQDLPGLTTDGDYSIEVWYNGSGYNLDDLANVADSSEAAPRDNFPLVWDSGAWKPGSIVRDGSQASTSGGDLGIFAVDGVYLYVCVSKNSWKRIALETFS